MGDPGLLQKLPAIPALLLQGGGDHDQSAPADGTAGGLDLKASAWQIPYFALDDRLVHCARGGRPPGGAPPPHPAAQSAAVRAVAGGWFGGVARAAADPLPQLGQSILSGGGLGAQLLDHLLLSNDQCTESSWCRQPVPL